MDFAPDFVRRIAATFAPDGTAWLAELPALLDTFARRWRLEVGPPFPGLSYNYVAPALLPGGGRAVLKLGVPRDETSSEIDALRHYGGRGACRLLAADAAAGAILLERLVPGDTLVALAAADDEAATRVAATVMARLWASPSAGHAYRDLASWTRALHALRPHFGGGYGPFPPDLVDRALGLLAELLPSQAPPVVLHGDLHHFNILRAGVSWKAIDPKGLVGEPAFDCGPFCYNPWPTIFADPNLARTLERRLAIFAEQLNLDLRRVHGWAFVQAVLSAWWSYDDDGGDLDEVNSTLATARALATLRP